MIHPAGDLLVVGEAASLGGAVAELRRINPDVVLLRQGLSGSTVGVACRMLCETDPDIRVVIRALEHDESAFLAAVQAGAHGYLTEPVSREELLRAIRSVATGDCYVEADAVGRALAALEAQPGGTVGLELQTLSPQEERLLPLVAKGMTNKEIALLMGLSHKTVRNYLANVCSKLRLTRRAQVAAVYTQYGTPSPARS